MLNFAPLIPQVVLIQDFLHEIFQLQEVLQVRKNNQAKENFGKYRQNSLLLGWNKYLQDLGQTLLKKHTERHLIQLELGPHQNDK